MTSAKVEVKPSQHVQKSCVAFQTKCLPTTGLIHQK